MDGGVYQHKHKHDMGSLGNMLQIYLPRDWANLAMYRDVWRGGGELRALFCFISSFPFLFAFACSLLVEGIRHDALRSEWLLSLLLELLEFANKSASDDGRVVMMTMVGHWSTDVL